MGFSSKQGEVPVSFYTTIVFTDVHLNAIAVAERDRCKMCLMLGLCVLVDKPNLNLSILKPNHK